MVRTTNQKDKQGKPDRQELIRRVAQRVWELWREDLRRERERRDGKRRS